jgi:hypothetical protein
MGGGDRHGVEYMGIEAIILRRSMLNDTVMNFGGLGSAICFGVSYFILLCYFFLFFDAPGAYTYIARRREHV